MSNKTIFIKKKHHQIDWFLIIQQLYFQLAWRRLCKRSMTQPHSEGDGVPFTKPLLGNIQEIASNQCFGWIGTSFTKSEFLDWIWNSHSLPTEEVHRKNTWSPQTAQRPCKTLGSWRNMTRREQSSLSLSDVKVQLAQHIRLIVVRWHCIQGDSLRSQAVPSLPPVNWVRQDG